jgi:hypothetical protein
MVISPVAIACARSLTSNPAHARARTCVRWSVQCSTPICASECTATCKRFWVRRTRDQDTCVSNARSTHKIELGSACVAAYSLDLMEVEDALADCPEGKAERCPLGFLTVYLSAIVASVHPSLMRSSGVRPNHNRSRRAILRGESREHTGARAWIAWAIWQCCPSKRELERCAVV